MVIPKAQAIPVIAPNVNVYFIIGITEVVKTTAMAIPNPIKSPSFNASLYEPIFVSFSKKAITNVVKKQAIIGTMQ